MSPQAVAGQVRAKARALGFDAVGFARADVPLGEEMERYEAFLDAGMHGGMGYLAEHAEVRRRLDTGQVLAGARSVVCLARRYAFGPSREDGEVTPLVARYARGRDYHNFLRKKLRKVAAFLRALPSPTPIRARPLCDDAPVLERAWAARAGLGFIGKNGLLIVPGQGSFVLLGEVVTTLELPPDEPLAGRCGACTLCLDACPTGAFPRPFVLDARRCIAYWTIEHRGAIPEAERSGIGEHLFGCDICQDVCPFNASPRSSVSRGEGDPFLPSPELRDSSLVGLLTGADRAASTEGSPLKRGGPEGMARNAAIVLGNRRDVSALPELARAAEGHPSAAVRDAASWAMQRIQGA
jgi:epoxyqueuosine reductase